MEKIKILIVGIIGTISAEVANVMPLADLTPDEFQIPEIGESDVKIIGQILILILTVIKLFVNKKKKKDDNE